MPDRQPAMHKQGKSLKQDVFDHPDFYQMDDLLTKFRAHHHSGQRVSVASLRQLYDVLVLKVLALVQDTDPSLARTILASREAIWGILADPKKFDSVT